MKSVLTLYNIRQDHMNLMQQIEEAEGEMTPELEQSLSLTAEAFQEKAVSYGFIVKSFDASVDIIESEIKRLKLLQAAALKRSEMFKDRLSQAMHEFGYEKIETPTLKLSFRKSESVEILDEKLLPEEVKEVVPATYKISKTKIKEIIKRGDEVPGAALSANLNLQIK